MSQVAVEDVGPKKMNPYEIGWYIESADEDIYGPVSCKSLRRFLEDKTITPNTLVRHCAQPEAKPAADQPAIMQNLSLDSQGMSIGDKLGLGRPFGISGCSRTNRVMNSLGSQEQAINTAAFASSG